MSLIARGWLMGRQRVGRRRRAPRGADELVLVEVIDGEVVQELTHQEQRGVRVRGGMTSVERRPTGVSDGVAVRPSRRTEGCRDEACCSFPAGPVAALAAGDGERRGRLPMGAV